MPSEVIISVSNDGKEFTELKRMEHKVCLLYTSFACTTYPSDPAFMKRVEAEAEYNIKRLRNQASLAMWCGNNESCLLYTSRCV